MGETGRFGRSGRVGVTGRFGRSGRVGETGRFGRSGRVGETGRFGASKRRAASGTERRRASGVGRDVVFFGGRGTRRGGPLARPERSGAVASASSRRGATSARNLAPIPGD
ncbi:MAG: hypothetical protein IJZ10_03130 [Thermoguttaceae bacterium]|nr:hypothetical protein [Thermoguttaceae bacterium]